MPIGAKAETPHLPSYLGHPLPKGEGYESSLRSAPPLASCLLLTAFCLLRSALPPAVHQQIRGWDNENRQNHRECEAADNGAPQRGVGLASSFEL